METSTTSTPSTVLSLSTTLTTNSIVSTTTSTTTKLPSITIPTDVSSLLIGFRQLTTKYYADEPITQLMECPPKPTEPCVIYDSELICRTVCLDTEQCDGIVSGKLGDVTALGSREGCAVFVNKIIKLRESPYKGFPQTTTYIKVGRFASLDGKNVTLGVGGDIEQSSTSSFQPFSSTIIVYAISSAVFLLVVVGITIFIIMKQKKSRALRSLQTNNQTNLRETSVTMTYGIQPVYQQPPSYLVQYSSQPYVPPQQVYSNPPAYTSQLYPRPGGASQRNRTYATEPAPPC